MIFVDTSAWFSVLVQDDRHHQIACAWFTTNRERLLLTDYVLDETLTLLRSRAQNQHAIEFGREILETDKVELVLLSLEDIESAWEVFQKYADKEWSFTDCTSKVVMERLQISKAFAFDHHFHQFGSIMVVP